MVFSKEHSVLVLITLVLIFKGETLVAVDISWCIPDTQQHSGNTICPVTQPAVSSLCRMQNVGISGGRGGGHSRRECARNTVV